jgi:succinoglycan biosynthesis protein ExoW
MRENRAMRRIAVVIPYFQRETGILAGAVRSIAGQLLPWPATVDLIIVDDSSPVSPGSELANLSLPQWLSARIVRQTNAGPGAARNRGLDHVDPQADYIAFLDSDDSWAPCHLQEGIDALEMGHDFYFCDSAMPPSTLFASRDLFVSGDSEPVFAPIVPAGGLYHFLPGQAGAPMVAEYLCQTSAVILRNRALHDLRFDERLRYAGEDWLMWVRLAHRAGGICFSTKANAMRGEGINLYRDAHDRLNSSNLRRLISTILANRLMATTPGIHRSSAALISDRIALLQREIAAILLHPRLYRDLADGDARRTILRAAQLVRWQLLPLWRDVIIDKLRWRGPSLGESAT